MRHVVQVKYVCTFTGKLTYQTVLVNGDMTLQQAELKVKDSHRQAARFEMVYVQWSAPIDDEMD